MDFNNLWSGIDHLNCKQNTRCLAVNTILAGKYLVGPVLGQGGFGITYLGYDLNMETHIAIKEYFPVELVSRDTTTMHGDKVLSLSDEKSVTYQQGLKKYVAEAQNVSQFSEMPGVVSVKDFFYENETAYIVMEYIDGISLKDYLKEKGGRLSEEETLTIMKPVLEALVKVHDAGIIHRDISPDNIMLTFEKETTDGRILKSVKLIDFGAARMTTKNDQKSLTIILKHGYAPEEQYRTHGEQGPWTDVYAVCAVMYRMLTGETPVQAMDRMFKDELKGFDECNVNINANTSAAILKGLAVKKDDRIQDIGELIGILYEGNKVKTAIKTNKKHLFIFAGIGVALIISFLVVIVGSNNRTNGKENNIKASDEVASTENFANQSVGNDSVNGAESDEDYVTLDTDVQEENVVQLVRTTPQGMLASGDDFILSLRADGTVRAAGNNEEGQCEVSDWYDVVRVYSSRSTSAGLRKDGTVVIAGNDDLNRAVSSWSGIVDIALDYRYILGLTKDGKVISAGRNDNGCCDTGDWENIVSISSAGGISFGVTNDGKMLIAGTEDYYIEELAVMSQWKNIKQIGMIPGDGSFYGLKTDGTVLYTGEWHKESLDSWSQISTIVTGENWLAGLKEDGSVVSTSYTYLGLGDIVSEWSDIVEIAGTFYNMVGLKKDGTLVVARKVKSVSGEGWCSIDDILAMNDIKQAVWVGNYLVVLRKNGRINATVKQVNRWLSPSDISEWKDISIIVSDGYDGLIGITKDGTILREEKEYVSVSRKEISSKEASERKEKTPRIYNSWKNVNQISASHQHLVALLEDGTVKAAGFPESQPDTDYRTGLRTDGTCDVNDWSDIRQVHARLGYTIGVKNDGTLIWTPEEKRDFGHYKGIKSIWGNNGYYDNIAGILEDGTVIEIQLPGDNGMSNFTGWTDMIQLGVANAHIAGLRADGTVLATGSNFAGQCDVEEWTDVVYIDVCDSATIGVTSDGRLLMAGAFPNDLCVVEEWEALPVDAMLEAGTKK